MTAYIAPSTPRVPSLSMAKRRGAEGDRPELLRAGRFGDRQRRQRPLGLARLLQGALPRPAPALNLILEHPR
eukprot:11173869-Lingulodinium_polyedra.AAC.1